MGFFAKRGDSITAETNGNSFMRLMHLLVFNELNRMRVNLEMPISAIMPEKTVLLEKHGIERQGRFDFLVNAGNKTIGIEVLTRPSKGKLRNKLAYANEVDEFIFVLPENSMPLYKKPSTKIFHKRAKLNFLGSDFNSANLKAWLVDMQHGSIVAKEQFRRLFNVKP